MKIINASPLVLFRLHATKIYTNNPEEAKEMYHANTLGFSIINVSDKAIVLDGRKKGTILLTFHTGTGSESLFPVNTPESDFGVIEGSDLFLPSTISRNPIKPNQIRMLMTLKNTASFQLDPGENLSFYWKDLITNTLEGFCTLSMSFTGIAGLESLLLSQTLYKECISANIINFYASPSGGAPASRCTLHWKTENTDAGSILPIEYPIFTPSGIYTSSHDITLDKDTHYYLNISNRYGNTYEDVFVHIIPPVIAAAEISGTASPDKASRLFTWEVHFANKVELMTGNTYTTVDSTGSAELPYDTASIALRCGGLYTLERRIALSPLADIRCFSLDIWTFPSHQCLILTWQTIDPKAIMLSAWDNEYYTVSTEACGAYEQIYPADIPVTFRLSYECNSGKGDLFLSNKK